MICPKDGSTTVSSNAPHMAFILGSGSPRRLDLLAQLGVVPDAVRPPDIDETPMKGELPRPYCTRISRAKVLAVEADKDDIVLCADTTVAMGRRILGKPSDAGEAAEFLLALSGRRHRVITAVAPSSPLTVVTNPKDPRQPVPASDGADYLKTIPGFSAIRAGGKISFESLPGQGTTFHITIPAAKPLRKSA